MASPKPTKQQTAFAEFIGRAGGCYLSIEGADRWYRTMSGEIVDRGMVKRCTEKGLLVPLSFDLQGEPQQWGVK